ETRRAQRPQRKPQRLLPAAVTGDLLQKPPRQRAGLLPARPDLLVNRPVRVGGVALTPVQAGADRPPGGAARQGHRGRRPPPRPLQEVPGAPPLTEVRAPPPPPALEQHRLCPAKALRVSAFVPFGSVNLLSSPGGPGEFLADDVRAEDGEAGPLLQ